MDIRNTRPEPRLVEVTSLKIIKDYKLKGSMHNTKIQNRLMWDKCNIVYIKNPCYVSTKYGDEQPLLIALTEDEYNTIELNIK